MLLRAVMMLMFAGSALAAPPWAGDRSVSADSLDTVALPPLDVAKARAEDYAGKPFGDPPRIGLVAAVDGVALGEGAADAARWSSRKDGGLVWRLAVDAPNAIALDFSFRRFRLPAGAELWIRSPDGSDWIGPYTDADNTRHGRFYTPMLMGSQAVLELHVPAERRGFVELELSGVNRSYRDIKAALSAKSGSCNIDVACPQGDPYREQIRSVAHYTFRKPDGTFVCTGQLVATTQPSRDPLEPTFVTAHHCVSTAAEAESMVLYWRYESPTCRPPGSAESGQPLPSSSTSAATQSGARLLAAHRSTDFTATRLDTPVPAAAQPYFSGWDRSESGPSSSVSIHHPAGHEKRIALNTDPLVVTPSCIISGTPGNTHWEVNNWNQGTTEAGSSGAGLWRGDSKRLIGVLSGGAASCTNTGGHDCYGRLAAAWDGGGSATTRMRDWLDPAATGSVTHDPGTAQSLQVSLSSTAFTTLARAGDTVVIEASASGGAGPYSYQWDTDGAGVFERTTATGRIEIRYARRTATQVTVRATDADGVVGQASRAIDVRGPVLAASAAGAPVQICGNNDATIDPGEQWRLPVRLANTGNGPLDAGHALFADAASGGGSTSVGPNSFGYVGGRSSDGLCSYSFIDIGSGTHAVAALDTYVDDGNPHGPLDDARTPTITLGGSGFEIFGERRGEAVMSTNGYVSFSNRDTGAHWPSSCNETFDDGAEGPQLRPLFDDLVIASGAGAGLRYRYFASCPRQPEVDAGSPQGCHVFQWNRMRRQGETAEFDFQAVAYERSGQVTYQYRSTATASQEGYIGLIGLIDAAGSDALQLCDEPGTAEAGTSICLYSPKAQPAAGDAGAALRLLQPAVAVPSIAAGGSVTVDLPFAIDAGAACGSPLRADFIAGVDARAHAFARAPVLDVAVGSSCQPNNSCPTIGTPPPPGTMLPRGGLYFDPARDGNGLNTVLIPQAANRTVFGGLWYTGERSHLPIWYQLIGEIHGLGGEVDLLRYRNTAAPGGFAPVGESAGRAWVGFAADGSLLLAWDIVGHGSGAERMQRQPQPFSQPNHTGAWYNPAESGWGLAIESIDFGTSNLEFVAAYLYDAAGNPRWAVGSLPTVAGGRFDMLGYQPQCPGCPRYADVQERVVAIGPLTIQYGAPNTATLSSTLQFPPAWSGSWNRSNLPIEPLVPPAGASTQ